MIGLSLCGWLEAGTEARFTLEDGLLQLKNYDGEGLRSPNSESLQATHGSEQLVKWYCYHRGHGGIIQTTGGDDLKEIQEPHHL